MFYAMTAHIFKFIRAKRQAPSAERQAPSAKRQDCIFCCFSPPNSSLWLRFQGTC